MAYLAFGWRLAFKIGMITSCSAVLAACSLAASEWRPRRDQSDDFFSVTKETDWRSVKHGPLVHVPNSGARQSIDEEWGDNDYQQRVVYGSTSLSTRIKFFALLGGGSRSKSDLTSEKPTKYGISRELANLSDVNFHVLRPIYTKYGVMGVAASRHCVYAWQWLDDIRGLNTRLPSFHSGEMPASIRILHCNATGSVGDLLADLEHYTLTGSDAAEGSARRRLIKPRDPKSDERAAPSSQNQIPSPSDTPLNSNSNEAPRAPNGKQYLAPQSTPKTAPIPVPDDEKHSFLNFGKPVHANPLLTTGTANLASKSVPPPYGW